MVRRTRPGISRFSDVQLHIGVRCGACHRARIRATRWHRPGMTRRGSISMPVTLDPDAAFVFKAFQEAGRPAYETLSPDEAREYYRQARFVSNPEPPELKSVAPLSIPSPGGSIPARIYTPKTLRQTGGLAPCLVFFHGGGWVIGDLDTHDVA